MPPEVRLARGERVVLLLTSVRKTPADVTECNNYDRRGSIRIDRMELTEVMSRTGGAGRCCEHPHRPSTRRRTTVSEQNTLAGNAVAGDETPHVLDTYAALTPLILMSGVVVMFTSSFLLVPINTFLGPEYRAITTPIAGALLLALVAPLVAGVWRRLRAPLDARTAFQGLAMVGALVLAGVVFYLSVFDVGRLGEIAELARKDLVIYIIGGLVWYLPSFGISAGVWRRLGLV